MQPETLGALPEAHNFLPILLSTATFNSWPDGIVTLLPLLRLVSTSCLISANASSISLPGSFGRPSVGCLMLSWLAVRGILGPFRSLSLLTNHGLAGLAKNPIEAATPIMA